jgi:ribosome-binding protein aMBF1 (putative translation factor)
MTDANHSRFACDQNTEIDDVNTKEKENSSGSGRDALAKAFGEVLKEQRKARGLSQEELAARCEVERTYPSLLERGLRTPTLITIVQLADALSIPAPDLVALTLQKALTLQNTVGI